MHFITWKKISFSWKQLLIHWHHKKKKRNNAWLFWISGDVPSSKSTCACDGQVFTKDFYCTSLLYLFTSYTHCLLYYYAIRLHLVPSEPHCLNAWTLYLQEAKLTVIITSFHLKHLLSKWYFRNVLTGLMSLTKWEPPRCSATVMAASKCNKPPFVGGFFFFLLGIKITLCFMKLLLQASHSH